MPKIIWIGLGWLILAVFVAWAWHRARRREETLLRRAAITLRLRWGITPDECKELCSRFNDCRGPKDCLLEPDPDSYEEVKEKLEAIFSRDDPDEVSPEDRRTGREIESIAAMILQEAGGKK